MEDSRQSREHGVSLLAHRRQITADVAKSGDPSRTAKGARNLLLHFGPAKIALRLVIRKRNAQVVKQSQHLLGTRHQRIQQILGLALLGPAFARSSGRHGGWRLSRIARRQNLEIASDPFVALDGGNSSQVEQTPLLTRIMQIEQEVVHLHSPLLLFLLGNGGTVSHQVSATNAVSTAIRIIAGQSVVHASPSKARPDADLVHRRSAARRMPGQMRQKARAVHMQPMQHAIHADAGLISMLKRAGHDQLGNALHRRSQPLGGQFAPLQQGSFRDLAPTQRRERLAGASRGQQLSLVQIHGQRLHIGTILDGCTDRKGKAAVADAVTGGATDGFDPMLVGQEADFRHIQDLTAFGDDAWHSAKVLVALAAHLGPVTHHFIWLLHHREGVPSMSRLPSWSLAAGTTRTAGQTPKPIGRGRLTARSTVFGHCVFQLLDPSIGLGQLLFQRQQFRDQRFEASIFFPKGLQFFFLRHRCTLVDFLSFGKSVGDLCSYHWYESERDRLFHGLFYTRASIWTYTGMPIKSGSLEAEAVFAQLTKQGGTLPTHDRADRFAAWFHDGPTYWVRALPFEPNIGMRSDRSNHYHRMPAKSHNDALILAAILSSSTFYLFFKMVSNCRDLGQKEWTTFPFGKPTQNTLEALVNLGQFLEKRLQTTAVKCTRQYPSGTIEYEEYYPAKSKHIIDEIDRVLAQHYGFTDEELDFIINYDIKYRMGRDSGEEDE